MNINGDQTTMRFCCCCGSRSSPFLWAISMHACSAIVSDSLVYTVTHCYRCHCHCRPLYHTIPSVYRWIWWTTTPRWVQQTVKQQTTEFAYNSTHLNQTKVFVFFFVVVVGISTKRRNASSSSSWLLLFRSNYLYKNNERNAIHLFSAQIKWWIFGFDVCQWCDRLSGQLYLFREWLFFHSVNAHRHTAHYYYAHLVHIIHGAYWMV